MSFRVIRGPDSVAAARITSRREVSDGIIAPGYTDEALDVLKKENHENIVSLR